MDVLNTKIKNILTEKTLKVRPENIKKDVEVFGITGNYEGEEPNLQDKTVTPTTSTQTISADSSYDGLGEVTVNAVTNSIDNNITSGNIKSGVTILGVQGNVTELNGETITITPTTSQQVITPSQNKNAITQATVSAVTSAIDQNITSSNIKKNVQILGVTGSFEGSDTSDATASASDILTGKSAYISTGKVNGSMVNNGALSYTPGDSAISIPAGYTSGGTISAVDITTLSDYQACDEIADAILGGVDPYIFLDYIQSTGSQYIDTGYTPDHDTRIVMELSNNVSTGYAALWAADRIWGGSSDFVNTQVQSSSPSNTLKFIIWYPSSYYTYTETSAYAKHTYSFYRGTFIRDGVTVTTNNTKNNSVTSFNTLWIWRGHNQDVIYTSQYRLHSLKIYYNPDGTLLHNYIPAKRTIGNELGLYDTVTDNFYTNAGTGVFLAGEPLEEE